MSSARQETSSILTLNRSWEDGTPSSSSSVEKPRQPRPPQSDEAKERRRKMLESAFSGGATITSNKRPAEDPAPDSLSAKRRALSTDSSNFVSSDAATPKNPSTISITAKIVLSTEQQEILRLVTEGKNIFFTGSAGTGKSVLLREIMKALRKKFQRAPDAVAVTASTGIASCNIGGVTLHSFAGIGIGDGTAEHMADKIRKNKKAAARWMRTQVLIIDEISMVDGDLFDKLARIACLLRKTTKPFGGIQLIVCGDFFQLPPVTKAGQPTFAFEAKMWSECVERTFNLTKVFRQKDQDFIDMLNEMRFGRLSAQSIKRFKALARPVQYDDGIAPTELFPRREDVDNANQIRMRSLSEDEERYHALDGGAIQDVTQRDKLLANMMAPVVLHLKIDSQVMLIKNMDETLVNGSMGKVIGFFDKATYAKYTGGGLIEEKDDRKGKKKDAGPPAGTKRLPLVRFPIPGSSGYRDVLIESETWKVELPNGEVQASRNQLPLILAWAMSIHKSQGQTLERVKVDLRRVFEKGQAYVALSRATSLLGLQVLGFDPQKVQAHAKVIKWSKTLETIN